MGGSMQKVCGIRAMATRSLIVMPRALLLPRALHKELGRLVRVLPGVHHPVFRGKAQ